MRVAQYAYISYITKRYFYQEQLDKFEVKLECLYKFSKSKLFPSFFLSFFLE